MSAMFGVVAEYWPFLLTALLVGGWVAYDIARPVHTSAPSSFTHSEPDMDEEVEDHPHPRHSLDAADPFSIPATDFLYATAKSGQPIRLNWTDDDTDPHGFALHRDPGDWPTAVIPVVHDDHDHHTY